MNCIKCSADNKLKERQKNHGHCAVCRHEFAFDPKTMTGVDFTDRFFERMLEKLSVYNSLFFTPYQLYYFFNQRLHSNKRDPLKIVAGCAIAAAMVLMIATRSPLLTFLLLVTVIPFSVALLFSPTLRKKLRGAKPIPLTVTPQQVENWFLRWRRINGDVPNLLPPLKSAAKSNAQANQISPELKQYSFDRAVICEHAEIARCLIANNFHFENNSAVLSLDGYPNDIFDTVMDMLRRNPALHVYALHDASCRGVSLPHVLSTDARWFAGTTAKIFDLGLLPRQIFDRSVFVETTYSDISISEPVLPTLQPKEVSWLLAGNFVSLESFPPQMLLRIVTRGITRSRDPQAEDAVSTIFWVDGDPGIYYYGAESFG